VKDEEEKKGEYDVDDSLSADYLHIRDTGILDAILDHVEEKYSPAARALTELTSDRYLAGVSSQLEKLKLAMQDPETLSQLRKKYGMPDNEE